MLLICCGYPNDNEQRAYPVDAGRKLNVHKTFRRCPGRISPRAKGREPYNEAGNREPNKSNSPLTKKNFIGKEKAGATIKQN